MEVPALLTPISGLCAHALDTLLVTFATSVRKVGMDPIALPPAQIQMKRLPNAMIMVVGLEVPVLAKLDT